MGAPWITAHTHTHSWHDCYVCFWIPSLDTYVRLLYGGFLIEREGLGREGKEAWREGGREGGMEGRGREGREGGREGRGREGEGGREGREGGREGREGGSEGEGGREGGRKEGKGGREEGKGGREGYEYVPLISYFHTLHSHS